MQVVVSSAGYADMQPGYFPLLFFPVDGGFVLSCQFWLLLGELLLRFAQAVQQLQKEIQGRQVLFKQKAFSRNSPLHWR